MRPLVILALCGSLAAQTATRAVFTNLSPAVQPDDRERVQMAFDVARGRIVLGGGRGRTGNPVYDTWEWDGANWQSRPDNFDWRRPTRLVYAPQLGRVLAVSGEQTISGPPMQVHAWTGSTWQLLSNNGPLSRAEYFDAAWDTLRGRLVMFGNGFNADTWEWDGTSWALRGTGGPVPRSEHRMVYDAARQVVVLYGGQSLTNWTLTDTWEWNGVYWLERFGIPAPDVGLRRAIGYDSVRQRVVLHGAVQLASGGEANAVHTYDGTGWQSVPASTFVFANYGSSMAFDPTNNHFVLFGGTSVNGGLPVRTRTLSFATGYIAGSSLHGAGCATTSGVPTLTAVGGDRPVLGTSFATRFGSLPPSPLSLVFAAIGYDDQTWGTNVLPYDLGPLGMPGCSARLAPAATTVLANVGGLADWNIALPADPSLDGFAFFLQGVVLAPGTNPAGAVVSNSLRGIAGIL